MATIEISVTPAEKIWLQKMAVFYGITLSELVLKYSITQLEKEFDFQQE